MEFDFADHVAPSSYETGEGAGWFGLDGVWAGPGSVPVIGMAGEDLLRPVQLLEQHAAHQQMRPGHLAERKHRVGTGDDGAAETVGPADRECHGAAAGVAPVSQAVGEFDAAPARTALVDRDQ